MGHILIYLVALCNTVFSFSENSQSNLIKGKLVYTSCASIVVQIQDENYFKLANNSWTSADNEKFEHVFLVKNSCDFRGKNIEKNQEFYFKLIDDVNSNNGCMQCLKYESTPRIILSIDAIKP